MKTKKSQKWNYRDHSLDFANATNKKKKTKTYKQKFSASQNKQLTNIK